MANIQGLQQLGRQLELIKAQTSMQQVSAKARKDGASQGLQAKLTDVFKGIGQG